MAFSGTLEKCKACDKTVYVMDLLSTDGVSYHKSCFKCSHCKGTLVVTGKSDKSSDMSRAAPSKVSSMFCGTQDKCAACQKTAYPLEKVSLEGESYHKSCFRCSYGGCALTPSSYAALDGILYCKHHFAQLFKEKGDYNHVIKVATIKRGNSTEIQPADLPPADEQPPEEESSEKTPDQSKEHD
ncbi:Pollen-specific protein [Asimina triloba]